MGGEEEILGSSSSFAVILLESGVSPEARHMVSEMPLQWLTSFVKTALKLPLNSSNSLGQIETTARYRT